MKKSILFCGLATMMAVATTSCGNTSSDAATTPFEDSLATYIGTANGGRLTNELNNVPLEQRSKIDKADVIKGIETVLLADTAKQGFQAGLNIGMQLNGYITYLSRANNIDRKEVIEAFKKAFMNDSFPNSNEVDAIMRTLTEKAEENIRLKEQADKENSPEAIQNMKTGEAYINRLKQEDASIKTTDSGLSYKAVAEGEGENIKDGDEVLVNYVFKLIDGKILQETGDKPARLSVNGVIPGFAEGLKMMKKGSKYTLYVPGKIGYGVNGIPQLGVGPNTMLIYDVEVVEINPKK